jgi:hypothetical protein
MAGLSYGQARQFVLGELGGEAVGDESRLELLMQAALVEISNELDIVREQRTTATYTLEPEVQSYAFPAECSRPVDIRISGRTIPRGTPFKDLTQEAQLDINGFPAFWWEDVDNASFIVEPAVDSEKTAVLEYVERVDAVLYDLNQAGERVWRYIDLPEEVHYSFVKYCTGQAMIRSDPGLAVVYINSSLGEIRNWKNRKARSATTMLSLGSDTARRGRSMDAWEDDAARFHPNFS